MIYVPLSTDTSLQPYSVGWRGLLLQLQSTGEYIIAYYLLLLYCYYSNKTSV